MLIATLSGVALIACNRNAATWSPSSTARAAANARRVIMLVASEAGDAPGVAELTACLAAAERLEAEIRTESPWRRQHARRRRSWTRVERSTAEVFNTFRQRYHSDQLAWEAVGSRAARQILQTSRTGLQAAPTRDHARSLGEATLHFEAARQLAANGRYRAAIERAERAIAAAQDADSTRQEFLGRFADSANRRLWRGWVEMAAGRAGELGRPFVVVDKLERRLFVLQGERRIAEFEIELGARGLLQKVHAGDRATPEGRYRIVTKKPRGQTRYHKALLLDYPNRDDLARWRAARESGIIPGGAGAGSLIEIHGSGGRGTDWTDGCVALTNPAMDRLYDLVDVGTPVVIVGTLGSEAEGVAAVPVGR